MNLESRHLRVLVVEFVRLSVAIVVAEAAIASLSHDAERRLYGPSPPKITPHPAAPYSVQYSGLDVVEVRHPAQIDHVKSEVL